MRIKGLNVGTKNRYQMEYTLCKCGLFDINGKKWLHKLEENGI